MSLSAYYHFPPNLYQALKDEGFNLPPECGDILLEIPVDGLIRLHFVQNLTGEDLAKFGRALATLGNPK
jgi:hypothetical protein